MKDGDKEDPVDRYRQHLESDAESAFLHKDARRIDQVYNQALGAAYASGNIQFSRLVLSISRRKSECNHDATR